MNKSTIIEGIFWSIIGILSIIFCVILMLRLWANYSKNPVATSIDTSNPIWDLPFPAVTICNNNKVYRPHADIIAKNLHMNGFTTSESERFFFSLVKLIRPDKITIDNVTATQVLDSLNMTVEGLMSRLMQPCNTLLVRCAWLGEIYDCNKIFRIVKSREGFCCAFNYHYRHSHDHERHEDDATKSYDNFTNFNTTSEKDLPGVERILKVPGSGRDVGLSVALNVESNNYKASARPYIGATILIHDAIDFPDISTHVASVPPGHVLAVTVSGTAIKSMDSMRNLPLQQRLCFFEDELSNGKTYSFSSCMTKCTAVRIQAACGCIPFFYPKLLLNGSRTCYLTDISCILARQRTISEAEAQNSKECKTCLPQCTDKTYSIQIENIPMDEVKYDSEITRGLDVHNTSFVYIYFGDISYVEYRKESLLSWDGLLASFGGIFGLCLGGSVISVIEVIYLLVREFLKFRQGQQQLHKHLPPASEMFLSIPAEKVQMRKRNDQESMNKRVYVVWPSSVLQRRNTSNIDKLLYKCTKS